MFKRILSAVGAWLPDAAVRAVKTFGQATVAALIVPTSGIASLDDWNRALALGGTAAALSVLNNLASLQIAAAVDAQTYVSTVQAAPPVGAATFPQSPDDLTDPAGHLADDGPDDTGQTAA